MSIMRSKPLATIALAILVWPALAAGQADRDPYGCPRMGLDGPVRVMAYKFADEDPPSYSFRVVNGADSPIHTVVIGTDPSLYTRSHVPKSMSAPEGWAGRPEFEAERHSEYMHYLWGVTERANGRGSLDYPPIYGAGPHEIQPGESLSGFSIHLEYLWAPTNEDDRLIVQEDLRSVSFRVRLVDGRCHVGRVQPDGLQARQEPN